MILYPEMQRKVQKEIDEVVGRDREVRLEDKVNLPFTDAVINEVRRIATPFPMTPPRISSKDLFIGGYKIPKGIPVQLSLYSVLKGKFGHETKARRKFGTVNFQICTFILF